MDQKKKNSKYYSGLILKHKKYNLVIKLLEKCRFEKWAFEVIDGEMPQSLCPDYIFDLDLNKYNVYSTCTLRNSFIPLTDSVVGRILYGS